MEWGVSWEGGKNTMHIIRRGEVADEGDLLTNHSIMNG